MMTCLWVQQKQRISWSFEKLSTAHRRPCVMECLLLPFYFHTLSIHQFTLLVFPVMCFLFVCCQGCRGVWACEEVGGEQFAIWFPASTNCWSAWCSVLAASSSYKNYNTACSNQWWICFRWDLSYPASSCWIYTEAYQHRQWGSVYMLGRLSLILLWTQHLFLFHYTGCHVEAVHTHGTDMIFIRMWTPAICCLSY